MAWSRANLAMNTSFVVTCDGHKDSERRCAYCGKVIEADTEFDDYDRTDYYHCDCADAKKEIEIRRELDETEKKYKSRMLELRESLPKAKYKGVNKTVLEEIKYTK